MSFLKHVFFFYKYSNETARYFSNHLFSSQSASPPPLSFILNREADNIVDWPGGRKSGNIYLCPLLCSIPVGNLREQFRKSSWEQCAEYHSVLYIILLARTLWKIWLGPNVIILFYLLPGSVLSQKRYFSSQEGKQIKKKWYILLWCFTVNQGFWERS